jgi:serine-type D-Ala-D-Ala carboxypeptidase (penicillin-binding protein 5/6)
VRRRRVTAALLCASLTAKGGAQAAPAPAATAPVAYLADLGSGRVLLARHEHRRFPPASLTKIMAAYVAFEMIAAGELDPARSVVVRRETAQRWAGVGSSMNLTAGSRVPIEALLTGLMTASANDGAIVLAEAASGSVERFVTRMNREARRLGLNDSRFHTPNGWPDGGATYTSADDLAVLTRSMIARHPALYRRYVGQPEMSWNGARLRNRLPLLGVAGVDGVKTGYTREAGYGVVGSAERGGRRLVLVLAGLPSESVRREEARSLLSWGFEAWRAQRLFARGQTVAAARVQGGAERRVALIAPRDLFLTRAPGEPEHARLTVRYRGPVTAPIRRGQEIGVLQVAAAGQPVRRLPLVAATDVTPAGFFDRLRNGLLGFAGL